MLRYVADGVPDSEIARQLGVTEFTVKKHVANILRALGAGSRTEAAVRAVKDGLIG